MLEGSTNKKLPMPDNDSKFSHNVHIIGILVTTSKSFEKIILKQAQSHAERRNLLNASQFAFYDTHSMTLLCIGLPTT
jgi:hypothetical protein